MKQEDKELLLKDLCARLSYGVKYSLNGKIGTLDYNGSWVLLMNIKDSTSYIKPYLRPMSSMTEEETEDRNQIVTTVYNGSVIDNEFINVIQYIDWLSAHHFDYRGLIEKGLALEALEDMYNLKEK